MPKSALRKRVQFEQKFVILGAPAVETYGKLRERGFMPKSTRFPPLGHFFLLHLFIDHVTGSKLSVDILKGDAHLDHKDEGVVGKIGDLVDGFALIVCLGGNDHLGAFLTHLFEDLIDSLLKEIGGVGALGLLALSALDEGNEALEREVLQLVVFKNGIVEAGVRARMAGGAFLLHRDYESILIAIRRDGNDVLIIATGFAL